MRAFLRSGFTWRLVGGFALGALGVAVLHPASAAPVSMHPIAAIQRSL